MTTKHTLPQAAPFANPSGRNCEKKIPAAAAAAAAPLAVLVGLGANRAGGEADGVLATLERALALFPAHGIALRRRSSWYRTAPVGDVPQEDYVNAVALVATPLPPLRLLGALQRIEVAFARRRRGEPRRGPRSLDLDLLAYGDLVRAPGAGGGRLILPHPEMHRRAFVLVPLGELLPDWRHPLTGQSAREMLPRLPVDSVRRITS